MLANEESDHFCVAGTGCICQYSTIRASVSVYIRMSADKRTNQWQLTVIHCNV